MNVKSRRFKAVDKLLIAGMILPFLVAIALKAWFATPADGIEIGGAMIYAEISMPLMPLQITEAVVNSWCVMVAILCICLYLTHGITAVPGSKRQLAAEWIVETVNRLVKMNMGKYFAAFPPFIAAILGMSALSSLSGLLGIYAPTADISIVGGWGILVFILITRYKLKCGVPYYLKGFTEPIVILLPLNVLTEFATPVSMSFRHYGNIMSGSVIAVLLHAALAGLTNALLGWIPLVGDSELFRIGIPAILSLYFDIFSGCMQAFIFATLTMLNIAGAFPQEDYEARRAKRLAKKQEKEAKTA